MTTYIWPSGNGQQYIYSYTYSSPTSEGVYKTNEVILDIYEGSIADSGRLLLSNK